MSQPTNPKGVTPKTLLAALREEGAKEYGLRGPEEISNWFFRMGYRRSPPTRSTLYRWKRQHGCPFVVTDRRRYAPIWTTNLLLMAWAAGKVKERIKRRSRPGQYRFKDEEGRAAVEAAIRKKLLAAGASRAGQGTPQATSQPERSS